MRLMRRSFRGGKRVVSGGFLWPRQSLVWVAFGYPAMPSRPTAVPAVALAISATPKGAPALSGFRERAPALSASRRRRAIKRSIAGISPDAAFTSRFHRSFQTAMAARTSSMTSQAESPACSTQNQVRSGILPNIDWPMAARMSAPNPSFQASTGPMAGQMSARSLSSRVSIGRMVGRMSARNRFFQPLTGPMAGPTLDRNLSSRVSTGRMVGRTSARNRSFPGSSRAPRPRSKAAAWSQPEHRTPVSTRDRPTPGSNAICRSAGTSRPRRPPPVAQADRLRCP